VQKVDYNEAGAEAELLAGLVDSTHSFDPVYAKLDRLIEELKAQQRNATDLLPASAEPGVGFMLNQKRDGKTLLQTIAIAGRESLCDPEGEVRKKLSEVTQLGTGAVISSVMFTLGLPVITVPIAVAIVGMMLAIGIKGFCQWASAPADEPASA
jgi:alpha-D-ribose 1-methylphosphonate 5-triphosphate synthase subunit PhnH